MLRHPQTVTCLRLIPDWSAGPHIIQTMFGPLNGVRTALVIGAAVAALVAAAMGEWMVTAVLGVAIVAHGFGWLWLYRQHEESLRGRTDRADA